MCRAGRCITLGRENRAGRSICPIARPHGWNCYKRGCRRGWPLRHAGAASSPASAAIQLRETPTACPSCWQSCARCWTILKRPRRSPAHTSDRRRGETMRMLMRVVLPAQAPVLAAPDFEMQWRALLKRIGALASYPREQGRLQHVLVDIDPSQITPIAEQVFRFMNIKPEFLPEIAPPPY